MRFWILDLGFRIGPNGLGSHAVGGHRCAIQNPKSRTTQNARVVCALAAMLFALGASAGDKPTPPLPTSLADFFQPGTQPMNGGVSGGGAGFVPLQSSNDCIACHAGFGPADPFTMTDIFNTWNATIMAQSARDPVFHAGLAIANQDATDSGEFCIRCHAPNAYLHGRSVPTDASAFEPIDYEGVSCNFCHRSVDPVFVKGVSPSQDEAILSGLAAAGLIPHEGSNSRFIVDPIDVRRGPFDDVPANLHPANRFAVQPEIIHSPFHTHSEFCWNCHDVSNPLLVGQGDGTYGLATLQSPHPTQKQIDMMPLHRTYSEWKNSYYSTIGVLHVDSDGNPRFGGNHPTGIMKVCQDCHLPDMQGFGSVYEQEPFFERPDTPQHGFLGVNTWVVNAVRTVDADGDGLPDFPDDITKLSDDNVIPGVLRNMDFLARASDLVVSAEDGQLTARLINRAGHKLPTGFPDGRRVWINVVFFDCAGQIIAERGAYDFETGHLNTKDTKVYEAVLGIEGEEYAAQVGKPQGPTFHFILANKILKDNRIPPAGFSNILAQEDQSEPVGATYANGQHWDDTAFAIPAAAKTIVTSVYYQVTSREFMEFLRDANYTNNRGQIAYDLWVEHGMSTPVLMDSVEITVTPAIDLNQDGTVNVDDLLALLAQWGGCSGGGCSADLNGDGVVNVDDLLALLAAWGPC